MRWPLVALAVAALSPLGSGGLFPPVSEVSVRFPKLVGQSSFVCKGQVVSAPVVKSINGPLPRMTGVATVKIDRCFKGALNGPILVAADKYRPSGGWGGGAHIFTPELGEYLLLFLNRTGELYELADQNQGALPVSARTSTTTASSDSILNLEDDFKAGLEDFNPEMVLKSICWLGHLERLRSTTELRLLLDQGDDVERMYVF